MRQGGGCCYGRKGWMEKRRAESGVFHQVGKGVSVVSFRERMVIEYLFLTVSLSFLTSRRSSFNEMENKSTGLCWWWTQQGDHNHIPLKLWWSDREMGEKSENFSFVSTVWSFHEPSKEWDRWMVVIYRHVNRGKQRDEVYFSLFFSKIEMTFRDNKSSTTSKTSYTISL